MMDWAQFIKTIGVSKKERNKCFNTNNLKKRNSYLRQTIVLSWESILLKGHWSIAAKILMKIIHLELFHLSKMEVHTYISQVKKIKILDVSQKKEENCMF